MCHAKQMYTCMWLHMAEHKMEARPIETLTELMCVHTWLPDRGGGGQGGGGGGGGGGHGREGKGRGSSQS